MNNQLLQSAIRAAIRASQAIMQIYNSTDDLNVQTKDDDSPVTRADFTSNAIIEAELRPTRIPILSEESPHQEYDVRKDFPQLWVVDPLDGTKEFIKHNDMFAVCIALVEDHRPTLGVVAVPATADIYFTRDGKAWRAQMTDDISITCEQQLPSTFGPVPHIVLGSVSHVSPSHEIFMQQIREVWPDATSIGVGSAIKQCMLAEGSAAIYPRYGKTPLPGAHSHGTKEWDTAAGQAIIEAAGGQFLRVPDLTPLDYNRPDLSNPPFVALARGVSPDVIAHTLR